MASPTQAQQPLRACSDTTSKRRQSPQASNYPRDVGRLGAEPPYDGGATTACEAGLCGTFAGSIPTTCNHIRRETPTKWRPSYNLQKERPSPGPLSSQIAVLPPSLAPNSPKSIASRASVATLASCSYTTDAVCPHQRDSVPSICLIQSSRQSTIDFSAPE